MSPHLVPKEGLMGYVYQPKLKDWRTRPTAEQRSAIFWMKYYVNGRAVRESTGTDDKEAAKRELKKRKGAAASGQPVMPRVDRIRYDEAAGDLRQHYETSRGDHAVPRWAREA
jgi:hypothetical protein